MQHTMQKYFDDIVKSSAELIRFDSSMKPADGEYPFGKENADCLAYFLSLAESFGFEVHNYDNYVGEVVFGQGEPFAILAHLDVVPAGSGWKYPPFGGVINDDVSDGGVTGKKLWGRGTMDDKTPAVVCLYALKALKDEGIVPHRTFKLIVGCNEENGWKCIAHYKKVATMPKEGFTPDCVFPVIYAEKGILHFTAKFTLNDAPMSALNGGECANMVCGEATATLTRHAGERLVNYQNPVASTRLSYDNTTNVLHAYGKPAHGSTPDEGANALEAIFAFLATFNEDCKHVYDVLFANATGLRSLFDETGYLTMSPDIAHFENGVLSVTVDIRYPATMQKQNILTYLDNAGLDYVINSYQAPLYNDPNGTLISSLCKIHQQITGRNSSPVSMGGGTYARALECGCGFGPLEMEEESTIHQPNEYVTFAQIEKMSKIYYEAIKQISKPRKIRVAWIKPIKK